MVGRGGYRYSQIPAGELARIAGADRLEVVGDAVAGPTSSVPVAGLEAVERAHRWSADHLALEVVDAVARADEVPGGADEADRAAEMRAAGRDRDELVRVLVEGGLPRRMYTVVLPESPTPSTIVITAWR